MSVEPIGLIMILASLFALRLGSFALVHLMAVASVLIAAAAMFIGAANIQPGHVVLGALTVSVLSSRAETGEAIRALHPNRAGFWFACLAAYGIASAYFMPRLLEGTTHIVPLGTSVYDETGATIPLVPVSSNVTQSVYMAANLACLIMVTAIASRPRGFEAVLSALLAYCVANTAFALIDVVTYATGTQDILGLIRNARYVLHTEAEVAGMKRIVGSFTEASVFARSTLGVLGFAGTLWLCGYRPALTGSLAAASLVLVVLSTSSTGLVGAPLVVVLLYLTALARLRSPARQVGIAVLGTPLLLLLAVAIILANGPLFETLYGYVDLVVLGKGQSDSAIERSAWNVISFQNFLDSWGLGVGLGTARASSIAIALLATVGIPGAVFYAIFAFETFIRPRPGHHPLQGDAALAARNGAFGLILGDLLVGPVIDQGLFFYMLAGLAAAVPARAVIKVQPLPWGVRA